MGFPAGDGGGVAGRTVEMHHTSVPPGVERQPGRFPTDQSGKRARRTAISSVSRRLRSVYDARVESTKAEQREAHPPQEADKRPTRDRRLS